MKPSRGSALGASTTTAAKPTAANLRACWGKREGVGQRMATARAVWHCASHRVAPTAAVMTWDKQDTVRAGLPGRFRHWERYEGRSALRHKTNPARVWVATLVKQGIAQNSGEVNSTTMSPARWQTGKPLACCNVTLDRHWCNSCAQAVQPNFSAAPLGAIGYLTLCRPALGSNLATVHCISRSDYTLAVVSCLPPGR